MARSPAAGVVLVSVGVFAVSLVLPAFSYVTEGDRYQAFTGIVALGLGVLPAFTALFSLPSGDLSFLPMLAWFANPMLLAAWVATGMNWRRGALGFGLASLALGLGFAFARHLQMQEGTTKNVWLGAGYYTWIAAMVVAVGLAWLMDADVTTGE